MIQFFFYIFLKLFTEVVRAMHYVISQGWAMYWGTARWSPVEVGLFLITVRPQILILIFVTCCGLFPHVNKFIS